MTQQEIFKNMTKGEWITDFDGDSHSILLKEKKPSFGKVVIADHVEQGYDEGTADAAAIVSAVNELYGKGRNPEALDELFEAVEDFTSKVVLRGPRYTLLKRMREALAAAKL